MIYATTELAVRRLLDDRKDEIVRVNFKPDGSVSINMTNKLKCEFNRLIKNLKETEVLW